MGANPSGMDHLGTKRQIVWRPNMPQKGIFADAL